MNTDMGNTQALTAGANAHSNSFGQWLPMNTAPRDGRWVELKCTYGVAPWFCVARWTDEAIALGAGGPIRFRSQEASWVKLNGGGRFDEAHLSWRPYDGDPTSYADPTGGAQNSVTYWRGAIAAKYGLPADHFERNLEQKRDAKVAPKHLEPKHPASEHKVEAHPAPENRAGVFARIMRLFR